MVTTDFLEIVRNWRWACLLALLLAAMFLAAAAHAYSFSRILTMALYMMVFVGTLYAADLPNRLRILGLSLVFLWFFLGLLGAVRGSTFAPAIFVLVTACILIGCLIVTISELAHNRDAGLDPILGAVFGYILIGVSWSLLYVQIEINTPGSFDLPAEQKSSSEFIYFSLVTLTSLGYGDITPLAPIPRLLAGIEAATGTIYIAVFIGRIVARFAD